MSVPKLLVLGAIAAAVGAWLLLDAGSFLSLAYLRDAKDTARGLVEGWPVAARAGYFALYVAITAASLPGAAVLTLAGGAVFGLAWGMALVSFASSIGATLAFLAARIVLGDWVQRRFAKELARVNDGFDKHGAFYLFSLRMTPLFPFFVVNLAMGLTRMRVLPYYLVSQAGMLAGTFVFVFAGTQIAEVGRVEDILSPGLILALTLLGAFPFLAKQLMAWLQARRSRGRGDVSYGEARPLGAPGAAAGQGAAQRPAGQRPR